MSESYDRSGLTGLIEHVSEGESELPAHIAAERQALQNAEVLCETDLNNAVTHGDITEITEQNLAHCVNHALSRSGGRGQ